MKLELPDIEMLIKIWRKGSLIPRDKHRKICRSLEDQFYLVYGAEGYTLTQAGREIICKLAKEWCG